MGKTKVVLLLLVIHVCRVLDSRKWIVPKGMAITLEAMGAVLEKNIESLSKIFDHFIQMFKRISPAIAIEKIIDEYISLVMYAMKNYNYLTSTTTEDLAIVESV